MDGQIGDGQVDQGGGIAGLGWWDRERDGWIGVDQIDLEVDGLGQDGTSSIDQGQYGMGYIEEGMACIRWVDQRQMDWWGEMDGIK